MNRRQLAFVIILNALVSLVIALAVVWVVEARRPDPEALAAVYTPLAAPIAVTFTPTPLLAPPAGGQLSAGQPVTASAPTAAAAPATGEENVYVIKVGDSLSSVADFFGVSMADIVQANKLDNPDFVFVGQRLLIPSAAGAAATTPTPAVASGTTGIRLSTIANPSNLGSETIGVVNDSDLAVNLQGWRVEKEGGPAYTFGNSLLFPGSGVQLHSGAGADSSADVYWNQPAAVWAAGAVARLINAQGVEIARLAVQ